MRRLGLAVGASLTISVCLFWLWNSSHVDIWSLKSKSRPVFGSPYIAKGENAEDKVLVMAKMSTENTDWVSENLQDWQRAIYHMDDPGSTLHPPMNKGREAMAYLTFLVDHYEILPEIIVFLHPHKQGWPEAWHNDAPDYDNVQSVRSLRLDFVREQGYVNMRCIHNPGCPDEIQPFRKDDSRPVEIAFAEAYTSMFGGNTSSVPRVIATPCCSQFAVSRAQVLKRSRIEYISFRKWLIGTSSDDYVSGRIFEYLWHIMFGKDPVWCPALEQCWCQQFGRC